VLCDSYTFVHSCNTRRIERERKREREREREGEKERERERERKRKRKESEHGNWKFETKAELDQFFEQTGKHEVNEQSAELDHTAALTKAMPCHQFYGSSKKRVLKLFRMGMLSLA
jgi:hypothetical protein